MRINIKVTNIALTPAILEYTEKRLSKVEKYLEGADYVMAVELGKNSQHHKHGEVFRAEVRISGGGANFYATKESIDLYASIDEVRDEIIAEISKIAGKKRSLMRRGSRMIKDLYKGFPWVKNPFKRD